jgi:hypothetical protein
MLEWSSLQKIINKSSQNSLKGLAPEANFINKFCNKFTHSSLQARSFFKVTFIMF